jgi:transcriptional regulator of met regulon
MNEFEQFIANEYGLKAGDDVSGIIDDARARFRAMKSAPTTQQTEPFLQREMAKIPETPNAQSVQQSRSQPADDGLFEMGFIGRQNVNPVYVFADEVAQQEAKAPAQPQQQQKPSLDVNAFLKATNARQMELEAVRPLATNNYRRKETDEALNNANNELLRRYATDADLLAQYGVNDVKTFNQVSEEPFEVRAKAWQIVQPKLDRGEVPDWLGAIEQVKKSNSLPSATGASNEAGMPKAPDDLKRYETREIAAARAAESPTPDNLMKVEALDREINQTDGNERYVKQVGFIDNKLNNLRDMMATPNNLIASGYTNPFTGQPIQDLDEAKEVENRLVASRARTVVEMKNAGPEFWQGLPSPATFPYKTTIKDAAEDLRKAGVTNLKPREHLETLRRKEWVDYEKSRGPGFLYVAPTADGNLNLIESTPVVSKSDPNAISPDNPLAGAVAEEEMAATRNNEAAFRSQLDAAQRRVARLADTSKPMQFEVSPTQSRNFTARERALEIEGLQKQITALQEKLSKLQ